MRGVFLIFPRRREGEHHQHLPASPAAEQAHFLQARHREHARRRGACSTSASSSGVNTTSSTPPNSLFIGNSATTEGSCGHDAFNLKLSPSRPLTTPPTNCSFYHGNEMLKILVPLLRVAKVIACGPGGHALNLLNTIKAWPRRPGAPARRLSAASGNPPPALGLERVTCASDIHGAAVRRTENANGNMPTTPLLRSMPSFRGGPGPTATLELTGRPRAHPPYLKG